MEEQKNKEVKMEAEKKLPYEKLSEIADNLFNENRYLKQQLQQAQRFIQTFNRLDYLFRVIEISNTQGSWHFSDDFCAKCMEEIEATMTIPEEEEETKEEN